MRIGVIIQTQQQFVLSLKRFVRSIHAYQCLIKTNKMSNPDFYMKGNDLILALNRTNYGLNIRRESDAKKEKIYFSLTVFGFTLKLIK